MHYCILYLFTGMRVNLESHYTFINQTATIAVCFDLGAIEGSPFSKFIYYT
jgi:hypothetical protein